MKPSNVQMVIEDAFERRKELTPANTAPEVRHAVESAIALLDRGEARVAEKRANRWQVIEWLKMAVLLYFRIQPNQVMESGAARYYDKIPLKYQAHTQAEFVREGVRIVPPASVRYGAYLAPDVVLMPSYINIGAYVDAGSMVDTWATIGSCAQIGKHVHISGGAGIGGVLEPLQATPTIIEDDCFIGARSEIVEGVIVETGAVISMGVFIGQSTRIYDRETGETFYGRVPAGAVVVPGSLPSADGRYNLQCAIIVKRVDAQTRIKVGINELLRGIR
ncbi:MAG TPA: 2,3,4,5-tetrahydropyridine-2,6-dicarboxylate N-succinyltransferase [Gammaproteobacteria bacterium]|nr:2,3,4,5-tetrahydropyridine-2,6-dicarboxylate N-succinyltransferase [Gammaproteobacteria bacterium]